MSIGLQRSSIKSDLRPASSRFTKVSSAKANEKTGFANFFQSIFPLPYGRIPYTLSLKLKKDFAPRPDGMFLKKGNLVGVFQVLMFLLLR